MINMARLKLQKARHILTTQRPAAMQSMNSITLFFRNSLICGKHGKKNGFTKKGIISMMPLSGVTWLRLTIINTAKTFINWSVSIWV